MKDSATASDFAILGNIWDISNNSDISHNAAVQLNKKNVLFLAGTTNSIHVTNNAAIVNSLDYH